METTWFERMSATRQWQAVDAPIRGIPGQRSPQRLVQVIQQFRVEACQRYAPHDGKTWCNTFVWDVTRALGCEIPHWTEADGRPSGPGKRARELTANGMQAWLENRGASYGWRLATAMQAHHVACLGCPAVATWANPNGHGHVAIAVPNAAAFIVAQAGLVCSSSIPLRDAFGSHVSDVEWFIHS